MAAVAKSDANWQHGTVTMTTFAHLPLSSCYFSRPVTL